MNANLRKLIDAAHEGADLAVDALEVLVAIDQAMTAAQAQAAHAALAHARAALALVVAMEAEQ